MTKPASTATTTADKRRDAPTALGIRCGRCRCRVRAVDCACSCHAYWCDCHGLRRDICERDR